MAWFRTDPQEVLKETVLWTNPAPTSSFASQTVTLSDDISNYTYLKVEYKIQNTSASSIFALFDVEEFKVVAQSAPTTGFLGILGACTGAWANASFYKRVLAYQTETSIYFANASTISNVATATSDYLIPTQIIGIKRGIEVNPVLDLSLPPDAIYTNASMANNATATLAVTQKPKYIIAYFINASTGYVAGIFNTETEKAYRYGYWSSAYKNSEWSNRDIYITEVSDSAVSIKNSYGSTCNVIVGAYY